MSPTPSPPGASDSNAGAYRPVAPSPPDGGAPLLFSPGGRAYVPCLPAARGPVTEAQVEGLARVAAMDAYSARLRLALQAPTPLAVMEREAEASRLVRRLAEAGIAAFLIPEESARRISVTEVRRLEPDRRALRLTTTDGHLDLRPRDVLAIVSGTLKSSRIVERFAAGGHHAGEARTTRTTQQEGTLIDLHLAHRDEVLRLDSRRFDFTGIYPGREAAPLAMAGAVRDWLRSALPRAAYHDQFDLVRERLGLTRTRERDVVIRALLPESPLVAAGVAEETRQLTETDEEAFQRYSVLARYEARALSPEATRATRP